MIQALRDALTAYGHHADDCEYALTVCTCGFTEAMRSLFATPPPVPPPTPAAAVIGGARLVKVMTEVRDELAKYWEHGEDCGAWATDDQTDELLHTDDTARMDACDCGIASLLNRMDAALAAAQPAAPSRSVSVSALADALHADAPRGHRMAAPDGIRTCDGGYGHVTTATRLVAALAAPPAPDGEHRWEECTAGQGCPEPQCNPDEAGNCRACGNPFLPPTPAAAVIGEARLVEALVEHEPELWDTGSYHPLTYIGCSCGWREKHGTWTDHLLAAARDTGAREA